MRRHQINPYPVQGISNVWTATAHVSSIRVNSSVANINLETILGIINMERLMLILDNYNAHLEHDEFFE